MLLNEYVEKVMEERLADLHTVALAKVVSFNNSTMTGSVKPLFSRLLQNGQQIAPPIINGVPVAGVRSGDWTVRIPYKPGDVVLIAYAERAIDTAISTGEESIPAFNRKHSIDDAVIIGGVLKNGQSVQGDGIVIEGPASKMHLKDGGNIELEGTGISITVSGNLNATVQGNSSLTTVGNISLSSNPGSISITAPVGGVSISGPISSGSW